MRRTSTLGLVVAVVSLPGPATAAAPPTLEGAPEREDDHWRPAEVEWWSDAPTPPSEAAPEYPLAAAFDPACDCNYTPNGIVAYEHVVVHTMQGSYAGTKSWFKNPVAKVSAHYIMRSVDGEVTQMVLDKDKAWHVGSSNSTSIGIEHEGYVEDPAKWYTWETYVSSARLARWLATRHEIPIDRDHILGHVELPNQTHTDPGPGWNWEMYMGLVWDVVPQGEIHVVVVDRSKACTITANTDTYLRRTAEPLELLAVEELCPIPAGSQVTYLHASADIGGRRRLLMEGGQGPCVGQGLDAEAFVDPADFSALCDPATSAAVGASVSLDGGAPLPVGADGVLLLPPVAEGGHTLDVTAPGLYEPASEGVDLPVYPGVRLAIAVDPVVMEPPPPPPPDTTGGETSGGGGDTGIDETGGTGGSPTSSGGGGSGASVGTSAGSGEATGDASGEPVEPPAVSGAVLPPGYGQSGESGCGCDAGAPAGGWMLALVGLLGSRRRRSV